jgi:hypothetical protein
MAEPTPKAQISESKIKPEDIVLPNSSYWPILLALSLTILLGGLAIDWSFIIVGLLASLICTIGWLIEPAHPEEHH